MTAPKLTVEEVLARLEKRSLVDLRNPFKLRHDEYEVLRASLSGKSQGVTMPQNADQAVLMFGLAHDWLKHNAPERFTEAHRNVLSGKSQGWREWADQRENILSELRKFGRMALPRHPHKSLHWAAADYIEFLEKLSPPPLQGDAQEEGKEDGRISPTRPGRTGRTDRHDNGLTPPTVEEGKEDGQRHSSTNSCPDAVGAAGHRSNSVPDSILASNVTPPTVEAQEGEECCPHGRPLHQDCYACEEAPSPTVQGERNRLKGEQE